MRPRAHEICEQYVIDCPATQARLHFRSKGRNSKLDEKYTLLEILNRKENVKNKREEEIEQEETKMDGNRRRTITIRVRKSKTYAAEEKYLKNTVRLRKDG
jgi:hypothetical protein